MWRVRKSLWIPFATGLPSVALLFAALVFGPRLHAQTAPPGFGGSTGDTIARPIQAGTIETRRVVGTTDSIFQAILRASHQAHLDALPIGERVAAMGKLLLGTPYVAGTLDPPDPTRERLIIDLTGLDCVTFYESSLAFAMLVHMPESAQTIQHFDDILHSLRYRGGNLISYASRLHYTTEYFNDNASRGNLRLVTEEVGGKHASKTDRPINFMTTHRASYNALKDDLLFKQIQDMERDLNAEPFRSFIPKAEIEAVEKRIQTGDIIGITTNIAGLDCTHTGIAIRMNDGRIHFMHASSLMHKAIITDEPLAQYLENNNRQTGIIIARPLEHQAGDPMQWNCLPPVGTPIIQR